MHEQNHNPTNHNREQTDTNSNATPWDNLGNEVPFRNFDNTTPSISQSIDKAIERDQINPEFYQDAIETLELYSGANSENARAVQSILTSPDLKSLAAADLPLSLLQKAQVLTSDHYYDDGCKKDYNDPEYLKDVQATIHELSTMFDKIDISKPVIHSLITDKVKGILSEQNPQLDQLEHVLPRTISRLLHGPVDTSGFRASRIIDGIKWQMERTDQVFQDEAFAKSNPQVAKNTHAALVLEGLAMMHEAAEDYHTLISSGRGEESDFNNYGKIRSAMQTAVDKEFDTLADFTVGHGSWDGDRAKALILCYADPGTIVSHYHLEKDHSTPTENTFRTNLAKAISPEELLLAFAIPTDYLQRHRDNLITNGISAEQIQSIYEQRIINHQ